MIAGTFLELSGDRCLEPSRHVVIVLSPTSLPTPGLVPILLASVPGLGFLQSRLLLL